MIKSIELENFKAFKESGKVDFKKINIFVGPNSSGKSSFIKALLTLKNTIASSDNEMTIDFDENIGNFKSVVFGNKIKDRIKFKLNFREDELNTKISNKVNLTTSVIKTIDVLHKINEDEEYNKNINNFIISLVDRKNKSKIKYIEFFIKLTKSERIVIDEFNIKYFNSFSSQIKMERNSYYLFFNDEKVNEPNLVKPNKFFFEINDSKITSKLSKQNLEDISMLEYAFLDIKEQLVKFTSNIRHIEPLRNKMKRVEYVTNIKFNNTVGNSGENTITTLVGLEKKYREDSISTVTDEINKWLNEFDLGKSVSIKRLGNDNYSLYIKNKNNGVNCNILDVGVGTSQLLPIIIESINSPEETLLIIEEPESHIHPNAQSKLSNLFVDIVNKQNKKFLIETHSIFLIVQLQILIAQRKIKADDVSIYYFNQSENGSNIKEMKILGNGQFEETWPSGFFDVQLQLGKLLFESL
ncbi:MAG: DUF3696 domain-containing protein [Clostridium perfringens]|nr:DUF3696 domain-containing protein [Clostridium perfringens]